MAMRSISPSDRLEVLNKEYGTQLLISKSNASLVDEFALLRTDQVTVRGQSQSLSNFTAESPVTRQ